MKKQGPTLLKNETNEYIFEVGDRLGGGAFGSVYLGQNNQTKEQVAIKVMDLKVT